MIELKNVCYAYGNEIALRYINLNIQKGESVIIQGPNGCGKSTLIKILNGIIFPMEGSYTYEDHEITEKALKDSRFAKWFHQQMGYVFSKCRYTAFLRKCRRRNRLWSNPDGTFRRRNQTENRRLS